MGVRPPAIHFEEIELQLDRLNNGMDFHSESCEYCLTGKARCDVWENMVKQYNFYYIMGEIYDPAKT